MAVRVAFDSEACLRERAEIRTKMLACVGVAPLGVVGGVVHATMERSSGGEWFNANAQHSSELNNEKERRKPVSLDLEAHDADTKRRPGGAVLGGRFGGGGLLVVENGNSDVIVQGWLDGRLSCDGLPTSVGVAKRLPLQLSGTYRLVSSLRADHAPERETILINLQEEFD